MLSMKHILGIDIGGTAIKYGVVSRSGEVIEAREVAVAENTYETPVIQTLLEVIPAYIEELKERRESIIIEGIGVSSTGSIDSNAGIVVDIPGDVDNYAGTRLKGDLESACGIRVEALNDANAVLLAEQWVGAGKGYKDILALTYGTGIGGGVLIDGHILLGDRGFGGEVGHFTLVHDGEQCTCGSLGCYERYGSTRALSRRIESVTGEKLNGKQIFERSEEPDIAPEFQAWLRDIVLGITSLVHIFNPRLVIIGGGISREQELFIEPIKKYIHDFAMPAFTEQLEIVPAKLSNNAGMVGAAKFFIDRQ